MTAKRLDWLERSPTRRAMTMDLVDQVDEGLPLATVEQLSAAVAPKDANFKYRLVSKATYTRRRAGAGRYKAILSKAEGERVVRLARIWKFASEIWGGEDGARRFMQQPHMLLDGRTPLDVTLSGEWGGKMVEDILGRIAAGAYA